VKKATLSLVSDQTMLDEAFAIREAVFVREQHVEHSAEFDGLDQGSDHLLARIDGQAVGTLRLRLIDDQTGKIERVAVLKTARNLGIGALMIGAAILKLREQGLKGARLHAQTHALGFYEKFGFEAYGDVFDEDGIPHRAMQRRFDDGISTMLG